MRRLHIKDISLFPINTPNLRIISNNFNLDVDFDVASLRFVHLNPKNEGILEILGNLDCEVLYSEKLPPFIYKIHKDCLKELFEKLAKHYTFQAEVYDIVRDDVISAIVTTKRENTLTFEGSNSGLVRDITRKGKVDFYGIYKENTLKVKGHIANEKTYDCIKRLIALLPRIPEGIVEWTCLKERKGRLKDIICAWEVIK
jgi:hypothetical protein